MSDNINNCHDDDANCVTLPINEARLKEIKAMEEAEQRLIEDLFSTQVQSQKKPTLLNKKANINKKPK